MKKFSAFLGIGLIVLLGIGAFSFFYRLYQNDVNTLTEFVAAYQNYDRAVSEFSTTVLAANPDSAPMAGGFDMYADQALAVLFMKGSVRISSAIKNEKEVMRTMLLVVIVSEKELAALRAYQSAKVDQSADLIGLAKTYHDLTNQRQAAFAYFRELGKQ
jgi:hypothetical protein